MKAIIKSKTRTPRAVWVKDRLVYSAPEMQEHHIAGQIFNGVVKSFNGRQWMTLGVLAYA